MKVDLMEIVLKFLNKWLFPDFTNKLTWAVASAGILIITTPVEFKVALCNWIIEILNLSSISPLEVPKVEESNNTMGYVLILSSLVHNAIYKIISYKLDTLSFEIKREKRKIDLALYDKFVLLFPSSGETVLMLKDTDFGSSVSKSSMKAIDDFMLFWEGAEFTFNDDGIESKKAEFYKLATDFRYKVCEYMVPKDRDTLTVYPKNIDPEFDIIPQHVRDEISTLNKLASELYNKHQDFIVYCKKHL
ncbi:TPA: hypothetical protein NGU48_004647 [Vibrio parahaemolyticus]|uniref:hypothetical protein n=1 Tax=Vibrio parahaemolyticus TaxID=670 RepID=UPI0003F7C620|nr:hypothetical protein [Vibrio parahaemolyticus]KJR22406.1 hypothetical protein UF29_02505 [Vibrio parahaemolyticus]MBE4295978.1 hypothetical protein [Vibrio parahaemolyticus]MBE4318506.1 hypothetical protein [Vibrio parahaemolyticus]MBM4987300.1 hypothetical protein [Vibrio parahaemolyticus]HCE1959955.1 hypothetical protein [Vibrio parahaemolyticus]